MWFEGCEKTEMIMIMIWSQTVNNNRVDKSKEITRELYEYLYFDIFKLVFGKLQQLLELSTRF